MEITLIEGGEEKWKRGGHLAGALLLKEVLDSLADGGVQVRHRHHLHVLPVNTEGKGSLGGSTKRGAGAGEGDVGGS